MPMYDYRCSSCNIQVERYAPMVARREQDCDCCGTRLDMIFRPSGKRYFQDQIPGGLVIENLAPYPIRFESHSARRAYLKRHGIHEHVECVPGDKFLKRWG